jgi:hypothetical protein
MFDMNTFVAQIIYRIVFEEVLTEQYEEQWRCVFAADEREALEEARRLAKEEESSFLDRHGRIVNWKLVAVKDIRPFSVENGALLFSVVKEVEPVAAPVWLR